MMRYFRSVLKRLEQGMKCLCESRRRPMFDQIVNTRFELKKMVRFLPVILLKFLD